VHLTDFLPKIYYAKKIHTYFEHEQQMEEMTDKELLT